MRKFFHASKYLILVCVLLVALNATLGILLTRQSANAMRKLIRDRMLDISNTAAAMLDGDALGKLQAEDVDTPEYQAALKTLAYFQDNIELEYIYCIRDMGNKNFVFSIDPTVVDPGVFGEPIVYTDALYQASLGTPSVDKDPYEDAWGRFYSAYSPVFDSAHRVAGIVAVDFSASWFEHQVSLLVWTTVVIISIALIFSIIIAILIAGKYKRSFSRLFKEMNGLSEGVETLIREVTPDTENDEVNGMGPAAGMFETYEIYDDDNGAKDEIMILGDRIRMMQNRLSEQITLIRSHAYQDGLTGLENRMAYQDRIKLLEEKIASGKAEFTVAVFDVNQLKIINDDYGHEEGDRVISLIADTIRETFPEGKLYRIGGDEFVGILDGSNPKEKIAELKERLAQISREDKVFSGNTLSIAISAGYAVYDAEKDTEYASVFNRADAAMYEDKKVFYQTHEDRRKRKSPVLETES
ncbi:MAG: diguanylate cyclase [Lachnospiraceae bacterium]|nr:diguanylate cyclase [Lachnospiraceae bacterium]